MKDLHPTLKTGDFALSPCHNTKITVSLGDGVLIGYCADCDKPVCRVNPRTGKEEWLNGGSPWSKEDAVSDMISA